MSDQIKTQHGTIGLLMAECEQLRRDADSLHTKDGLLRRYHNDPLFNRLVVELSVERLGPLRDECEQLRRDLAQAKAENARLAAEIPPTVKLLEAVLRDDKDCSNRKIEERLASLRTYL